MPKKKTWEMPYNTEDGPMINPEYGRNVHNLVAEMKQVEDRNLRSAYAARIVGLMSQITPQVKVLDDWKEKLWNHLFRMAEYDLDIEVPEDIDIQQVEKKWDPEPVRYPHFKIKRRHYGYNVQQMIANARAMDDEEMQEDYAEVIGSYMKLAYRTWARDHYVSDEVILEDLEALSEGELNLSEDGSLDNLANPKVRTVNSTGGRNNKGGRNNRGRNRNRNNNNRNNNGGGRGRRNNNRRNNRR